MTKRIGILGGTFDPVHSGHIHAAQKLVDELNLDKLYLVPAFTPVHRDLPRASSELRLTMLQLAIEDHPKLFLDPREINRGGPS